MKMYEPQLRHGGHIFEPGEHDIDNGVYHASAGISRSGITEFKKSPLHYWQAYLAPNRIKKSPTPSMILGDAVHTKLLEPDLFDERFIVSQRYDGRTKIGKASKELFEMSAAGKSILDSDQYITLEAICNEVDKHPLIPRLLKDAKIERSLYWIDSETELLCKARPDVLTPKYIIDVKTTADSSYEAFMWSIKNYNYHIQAAMIIDAIRELTGVLMHNFIFITIQTTPPYKPFLYNLSDMYIEWGREEYKRLLRVLRNCFDTNQWDRDRNQVIEIDINRVYPNKYIDTLLECYECNY
jgi:exodeoxyribonuclease VIII